MTAAQFYERLLTEIQIDQRTWDAARDKRDGLAKVCCAALRKNTATPSRHHPAGALSQGTQIRPLNDVDLVTTFPFRLDSWKSDPLKCLTDSAAWFQAELRGSTIKVSSIEPSAHAVKIEFADEEFTADVVPALEVDGSKGLVIPHCPKGESHRWINTHPVGHRDLVKRRNRETDSKFARQIRILKWWNRYQQFTDEQERKPLASWHLAALALKILTGSISHAKSTPDFFDAAARLVKDPLPDPCGVGDPIVANYPNLASKLLREAGRATRAALTSGDPERDLRDVFGDPGEQSRLLEGGLITVMSGGLFVAGSGSGRTHENPRSHGDGA